VTNGEKRLGDFSDEKQTVCALSSRPARMLTDDILSHSPSFRHCVVMESARQTRSTLRILDGESIFWGDGEE
jgi:hypothetical protein